MLNASAHCELANQWKRRCVNVQSSLRANYQNENKGRRPVIRGFTTKRTQENGISLWERIEIDSREIRGVLFVCFVLFSTHGNILKRVRDTSIMQMAGKSWPE